MKQARDPDTLSHSLKTLDTRGVEEARALITAECEALRDLLLAKNAAYGNSALEPVRMFSKASAVEQIAFDSTTSSLASRTGVTLVRTLSRICLVT
jgi:hypothetical protein